MTHSTLVAITAAGLLLANAANADNEGKENKGHGNGHAAAFHCPPGLAKKNPPCIPPGQVGKLGIPDFVPGIRIPYFFPDIRVPVIVPNPVAIVPQDRTTLYGEYPAGSALPDDYVTMLDPLLYPFWSDSVFVRSGDFLYLIDPATGEILIPAQPVADWTWRWSDVDFAHCPPGLEKKNPPCVPPGQARQGSIIGQGPAAVGDHLPAGYRVIIDPAQHIGLDDALYVRQGDSLYRLDRRTDQVLNLIGTISSLLQ